jgi:hypothetical protein
MITPRTAPTATPPIAPAESPDFPDGIFDGGLLGAGSGSEVSELLVGTEVVGLGVEVFDGSRELADPVGETDAEADIDDNCSVNGTAFLVAHVAAC